MNFNKGFLSSAGEPREWIGWVISADLICAHVSPIFVLRLEAYRMVIKSRGAYNGQEIPRRKYNLR